MLLKVPSVIMEEDHTLSRFGYCGAGKGYCTTESQPETAPQLPPVVRPPPDVPASESNPTFKITKGDKTGKNFTKDVNGCSFDATEIVGGDMPRFLGGGGVSISGGEATNCLER